MLGVRLDHKEIKLKLYYFMIIRFYFDNCLSKNSVIILYVYEIMFPKKVNIKRTNDILARTGKYTGRQRGDMYLEFHSH
jgi:hypothetical protein